MKIAYIGTYPPRRCGIGTFTNNLVKSVALNTRNKEINNYTTVIALNNPGSENEYDYPGEVKFTIRQEYQRDYIDAAKYLNLSDSRVCILNHEFGIFGGEDGIFILPMLYRLKIPLIAILHTVTKTPSFMQKSIVQEIGKIARKIVVMSNKAVHFLNTVYGIPEKKIKLIEHGVPYYPHLSHDKAKRKYNFTGRKVILTFGLLNRNKGIETVLRTLTGVIHKHPDLFYIILGKTHPAVLKYSGEEYRDYLNLLVKKYRLQNNVSFLNVFVTEEVLFEYLTACDIYVTPYLNKSQITSGTLSYAVGAGAAILSTPYWHAEELLAEGRGHLFGFNNSGQLSEILNDILDNPQKLNKLRGKAFEYGKNIRWPLIGKQYLDLAYSFKDKPGAVRFGNKFIIDTSLIPEFKLDHIQRLTDNTGIIQHAKYGIPNLKEGYCLDDNSRALLMALMSYRQNKDQYALECIRIYLSFIQYMQTDKGTFHNFLSFNRNFCDKEGSEDAFGRTIWALGYLVENSPNISYHEFGKELFEKSFDRFNKLTNLRSIATTIIGISYYLKNYPSNDNMLDQMKSLVNKLSESYKKHSSEDWKWFEIKLTYDNAILPLSIFHFLEIIEDNFLREIALATTGFLEKVTMNEGYLSLIGNNGWYQKYGGRAVFDQQAIDAMASVRLFYQAYKITREATYIEKIFQSYLWFLGENDLCIPLYDYETCGCCDGLESTGINRNQGAESTLAYLISHLTVLKALEYESEYQHINTNNI